jgi:hypothetical protein
LPPVAVKAIRSGTLRGNMAASVPHHYDIL